MYLCSLRREELLELLPKGGEVAEIGVAEGTFSREILARVGPDRLHLIDPWEFQGRDDYKNDVYGNVAASEQQSRYEKVGATFAPEIARGQVVLNRAYSLEAADSFADGQLDWIYLDALHSREAVAEDLLVYKDKIKPGGFILGHDYTNHMPAQRAGFGVVEAVNNFAIEHGYTLLLVTMENFPTYVLSRTPDSDVAQQLRLKALYLAASTIELKDYPRNHSFQHHAVQIADRSVVYYSF